MLPFALIDIETETSMEQAGQYQGSPYPPPIPDPYNTKISPSHGYAFPYNSSSSYWSPPLLDPLYDAPAAPSHAPHAPPYASPQPPLADSLAALNIASQSSYNAVQNSYAPTVPSYDQAFPAQIGPGSPGMVHPYTSSQPAIYAPAGQSSSVTYGPGFLQSDYSPAALVSAAYGANQQGLQSYGLEVGLSQGQTAVYDQGGGLYAQGKDIERHRYGQLVGFDQPYCEKSTVHDQGFNKGSYDADDGTFGEVFAYDGGHTEPYGARGTGSDSPWGTHDSFNPSLNGCAGSFAGSAVSSKLQTAGPKVDKEDKGNGVQKYSVKLLPDSSSASDPMDVLCQIGLDGVRMIAPSTNKIVRIYPLETITRWEANEPSVFTFWAKTSVDLDAKRIRLQSSSYTINALLDILTAACAQLSEMVSKDGSLDSNKVSADAGMDSEQISEKKKAAFADWMIFRNRQNLPEEREHWVPDQAVTKCSACSSDFGAFMRRHHCRNCGDVFCDKCTHGRIALTADEDAPVVRVCDHCLAEVTQRLSNMKELSSKPSAPRSCEDLAKKLQEELERNTSKRSTISRSNTSSGKERSGQTIVLNCSACSSISLVNGTSTRCPACGVDTAGTGNSGLDNSSSTLKGPSDLWSNQSNSEGSGKHMQEVACPTCTVHLEVQVPISGTEAVECGVCQHPFLVSAH